MALIPNTLDAVTSILMHPAWTDAISAIQVKRLQMQQELANQKTASLQQQLSAAQAGSAVSDSTHQTQRSTADAAQTAQLQRQVEQLTAEKAEAESRVAELEGQLEAVVEQIGSSADQSVVALEKEVCRRSSTLPPAMPKLLGCPML